MTNFPTSLDDYSDPSGSGTLASQNHSGLHKNHNDAIEAIEAKLGIDGSAVTTSVDYVLSQLRGNLKLGAGDNSITTTATALIERMNVCSGTSADYTVTLPAASGNAGKLIAFKFSTALTKRVTLDGNGSETIDGATTRRFWAGEACVLICDGSNWHKLAYDFRPMLCTLRMSGHQTSITNATLIKVALDTTVVDNSGFMADTANTRIVAGREGSWTATGIVTHGGNTGGSAIGANASRILNRINFDGAVIAQAECGGLSGGYPGPQVVKQAYPATTTSDNWELYGFQNTGGSGSYYGGSGQETHLTVKEEKSW